VNVGAPHRLTDRVVSGYRTVAIGTFNFVLLFLLVNAIAHAILVSPAPHPEGSHFLSAGSALAERPELLRARYPGRSDTEIRTLIETPQVMAHPKLEFIGRPGTSGFYEVGADGIRSNGDAPSSRALNGAVWVFGGSTAFGHGVANEDTIAAALERLDPSRRYLNLGVQGYHLNLELDRLVHLLKQGHRPRHVIFIDGLNDAIACRASNFAPEDLPFFVANAYGHQYNIAHEVLPKGLGWFLRQLPVTKLIRREWAAGKAQEEPREPGYTDPHDPSSLYVRDPLLHYELNKARVREPSATPSDVEKFRRYYRANLELLRGLEQGFGFRGYVFFQPNGLLNLETGFVLDPSQYQKSELYRGLEAMQAAIKTDLSADRLPGMVDLSEADRSCRDCYVDAVHYDRRLAEVLAQHILTTTSSIGR
jgi:hypothetical protein